MSNKTVDSDVLLVGFPGISEDYDTLISSMMFLMYVISLTANGSVVCLVILNVPLHKPMYLFIANLAASNLLFDTATLPKLIARYWFQDSYMSFNTCLIQMFFVHYFGTLDSFLLMAMAVDRYVSIYRPLRYFMIITNKMVMVTCGICWLLLPSSISASIAIQNSYIVRCDYKIYSLFCTNGGITGLSCTGVAELRRLAFVLSMIVLLIPLGFILLSYILIIAVISSRSESWRKAFYTCSTHLLVVGLYYGPRIFVYIVLNIRTIVIRPDINALIVCLYSFVPHMANPVIYFLKTKEIRKTLGQLLWKIRCRLRHLLWH